MSQEFNPESYLKAGGFLKKDCWLGRMHLCYNSASDTINLVDSVSTSDGERILGVRETYNCLGDIPYAGKWVKCDSNGVSIDGDN